VRVRVTLSLSLSSLSISIHTKDFWTVTQPRHKVSRLSHPFNININEETDTRTIWGDFEPSPR
jgi:hypothetical protein